VEWLGLIDAMLELRRDEGLDLVVLDPLAVFLPGHNENTAGVMLEYLMHLSALTAAGLSVLLLHHPGKGLRLAGQAARGSGALSGHVDIILEMDWYGKPDAEDRRRWVRGYSRHEETRKHVVLELTAAGDDYRMAQILHETLGTESWHVLRRVLEDARERLTQAEILAQWPADFRKPDRTTLARTLRRAVEGGEILHEGTGRKNEPYHYWLPDREEDFQAGHHASAEEREQQEERWQRKCMQSLGIQAETEGERPALTAHSMMEAEPAEARAPGEEEQVPEPLPQVAAPVEGTTAPVPTPSAPAAPASTPPAAKPPLPAKAEPAELDWARRRYRRWP
jgi:hypothetical protein